MLSFKCALGGKANASGSDADEGSDEDDSWHHYFNNSSEAFILPLVFAVLALIMVCRSRMN